MFFGQECKEKQRVKRRKSGLLGLLAIDLASLILKAYTPPDTAAACSVIRGGLLSRLLLKFNTEPL